jgi:hypothetical protein
MMPQPGAAPPPVLSLEQAREALREVSALLDSPAVAAQIEAAKAAAGPDAMMAMMMVRPRAKRVCACAHVQRARKNVRVWSGALRARLPLGVCVRGAVVTLRRVVWWWRGADPGAAGACDACGGATAARRGGDTSGPLRRAARSARRAASAALASAPPPCVTTVLPSRATAHPRPACPLTNAPIPFPIRSCSSLLFRSSPSPPPRWRPCSPASASSPTRRALCSSPWLGSPIRRTQS